VVKGFKDGDRDFRNECLEILAAVGKAYPEEARAAVRKFLLAHFDSLVVPDGMAHSLRS
jgi:hypothetical protein